MKKIILSSLMFFMSSSVVFSQTNLLSNGDVKLAVGCSNGNNEPNPCLTFTSHSSNSTACNPSNWTRTHGTPSWSKSPNIAFDGVLNLWATYNSSAKRIEGEGVFAKHNFTPSTIIYVEVLLIHPLLSDLALKLRLLDDQQFPVEPALPGGCGEAVPLRTQTQAPELATLLPEPSGQIKYLIKYTVPPTQPGRKWDKLWVYPYTYSTPLRIGTQIEYIHIYEENPCEIGVTFNATGSYLPSGIFKENTFLGGSNNSNVTRIDPSAVTEWWYGAKAELIPVFEAVPQEDNYFLIAPDENPCEFYKYVLTKPGRNNGSNNETYNSGFYLENINQDIDREYRLSPQANNNINIYPNPSNGSFDIEFSLQSNYDIKVINPMGVMVYETHIDNNRVAHIDLQKELPPGAYIIQISRDDGIKYTKRIILNK